MVTYQNRLHGQDHVGTSPWIFSIHLQDGDRDVPARFATSLMTMMYEDSGSSLLESYEVLGVVRQVRQHASDRRFAPTGSYQLYPEQSIVSFPTRSIQNTSLPPTSPLTVILSHSSPNADLGACDSRPASQLSMHIWTQLSLDRIPK